MMNIKYKKYYGVCDDAKKIRDEVFVKEQGFKDEFDEIDRYAATLVFYDEDTPIGVCRYFKDKSVGEYHIGRVAVIKSYRGMGVGAVIMKTAENEIKADGGNVSLISAQLQAKGFYEKIDYTSYGDTYFEEHCEHIRMRKCL